MHAYSASLILFQKPTQCAHNKIEKLEYVTSPTALLGILWKVDLVLVAIDVENVQLGLPLVDDFGDRYYSNLSRKKKQTVMLTCPE